MKRHTALDGAGLTRTLRRMAHEILERNPGPVSLVGIHTRGVPLARRLAALLEEFDPSRGRIPCGQLDISFHRDDVGRSLPVPKQTDIPFDLAGATVILVDDVLFSGRTIRAALNALVDLGRAGSIQLAVLIDRGHRELPIRADYVGKNLPTARDQRVLVHLAEIDGSDAVLLEDAP